MNGPAGPSAIDILQIMVRLPASLHALLVVDRNLVLEPGFDCTSVQGG